MGQPALLLVWKKSSIVKTEAVFFENGMMRAELRNALKPLSIWKDWSTV